MSWSTLPQLLSFNGNPSWVVHFAQTEPEHSAIEISLVVKDFKHLHWRSSTETFCLNAACSCLEGAIGALYVRFCCSMRRLWKTIQWHWPASLCLDTARGLVLASWRSRSWFWCCWSLLPIPFSSPLSGSRCKSRAESNVITNLTSQQNLALSQRERERDGDRRKQGSFECSLCFLNASHLNIMQNYAHTHTHTPMFAFLDVSKKAFRPKLKQPCCTTMNPDGASNSAGRCSPRAAIR